MTPTGGLLALCLVAQSSCSTRCISDSCYARLSDTSPASGEPLGQQDERVCERASRQSIDLLVAVCADGRLSAVRNSLDLRRCGSIVTSAPLTLLVAEACTPAAAARVATFFAREPALLRAAGLTEMTEASVNLRGAACEVATRAAAEAASHCNLVTAERGATLPFSFAASGSQSANATAEELIEHVRGAVAASRRGLSLLASRPHLRSALDLPGMSDNNVRHLLSNLCSAHGTRYLEVGSWKCSTLVAALGGNEIAIERATAIDWWCGGDDFLSTARNACEANLAQFVQPAFVSAQLRLIESDCFAVDPANLTQASTFNVYFYDGPHAEHDHLRAFTLYDAALANLFVAVVDDWNHTPVRAGTAAAFAKLGYNVLYGEVLGGGRGNNDHTVGTGPWHNGLYLAVVQKRT